MKWILLALIIPATGFSMSCNELGSSIDGLEKQLMKSYSKKLCETRNDQADPFDCYSLATVEVKLRELENSRALLDGVKKLKETIQTQKESLRLNTKTRNRSAMRFADALVTAQSMELLVNTTIGDHNVLTDLKSGIVDGTINQSNFRTSLRRFCARRTPLAQGATAPVDACGDDFNPSSNAINEMTEVIRSAPIDQAKVDAWKAALAIKKSNVSAGQSDAYSFVEMRKDAGILNSDSLPTTFSKDQIKLFQDVPDIEDKMSDFGFIRDINEGKQNSVKRDSFKQYMTDLSDRQEFELQSKISVAYENYKADFNPSLPDACGQAKNNYASALECIGSLRSGLAGMNTSTASTSKAELTRLLDAVDITKDYLSGIKDKTPACLAAIDTALLPETQNIDVIACSGMITKDLTDADNDINQLINLRNRILEEQKNIVTMRDHAVKKLRDSCKPNVTESILKTCDNALVTSMDAEMFNLTSNMMAVSIALVKPQDAAAEINTVAACEYYNEDHKTESLEAYKLCEDLKTIPVPKVSEARTNRDEPVRRGTDPEGRERHPFWEGVAAGLPGLASQMAYNNMASMYQPISPYTLYPTNYGLGVGGTGYSSLPAYYLYPGLNYSPTPGATYYSSFLPGVTNYTPAASTAPASTTSFFNFSY